MIENTRILVVDDEPNLSHLVKTMLETTGRYDVREENRPRRSLLTARGFKPDLILLDVDMPGKDGGEIASEMQADPVLRGTPIVFLTALLGKAEQGSGNSGRNIGGIPFIAKPAEVTTLVNCIERMVRRPQVSTPLNP